MAKRQETDELENLDDLAAELDDLNLDEDEGIDLSLDDDLGEVGSDEQDTSEDVKNEKDVSEQVPAVKEENETKPATQPRRGGRRGRPRKDQAASKPSASKSTGGPSERDVILTALQHRKAQATTKAAQEELEWVEQVVSLLL